MNLCRLHCKQNGYGKLCIYVDSIVNRMDMVKFSDDCKHKMSRIPKLHGITTETLDKTIFGRKYP